MQDDALQQLYDEWSNAEDRAGSAAFVATDHAAAAFTLAASSALAQRTSGERRLVQDAPFTIEELAAVGVTSRSWMSPSAVAEEASDRLSTFFRCVSWVEKLVRDRRFVESVAAFLYEKHKPFLPHLSRGPSGGGPTEHSHEEFAVYEEFGRRVSQVILDVLGARVRGFSEREFVELLYDIPPDAWGPATTFDSAASEDSAHHHHILSFPAWRIILAMSDFEFFFQWIMDYMQEEYNITQDALSERNFAVGGARGLRALLRSTFAERQAPAAAGGAPSDEVAEGERVDAENVVDEKGLPAPEASGARPASSDVGGSLKPAQRLPSWSMGSGEMAGIDKAASLPPSGYGVRHEKLFPTPPSSADGHHKRRLGTVPNRNLPPLQPGAAAASTSPRKRSVSKKRPSLSEDVQAKAKPPPIKPKLSKPAAKPGVQPTKPKTEKAPKTVK